MPFLNAPHTLLYFFEIIYYDGTTVTLLALFTLVLFCSFVSPLKCITFFQIYLFFGNLCVSYAATFVVSLAFESPMMGLEKVLLKRSKNS
jgi:hypothetical protein